MYHPIMQKMASSLLNPGRTAAYMSIMALSSACVAAISQRTATRRTPTMTRSVCRARGASRRALGAMAARAMGDVFNHPNELHTTPLGAQRIQKNLACPPAMWSPGAGRKSRPRRRRSHAAGRTGMSARPAAASRSTRAAARSSPRIRQKITDLGGNEHEIYSKQAI